VGYNAVPPPAANLYHSKKDLPWTGLPKFADDTVTDYSRSSATVESTSAEGQNKHSTTAENGESTDSILSKPAVKFVKAGDNPAERPTKNKAEFVKAAERPTTNKVPANTDPADSRTGRTITATTEDMQKKKNDVKARTTLLLSLPDEHQLRFSKYKTARELWDAILKTFGDSMSLDDLYNHLKVYEAEVQKKPNSDSQDMAFISSSKNSNNEDGNILRVTTATTTFPTGSVNVATISQDTASAFIASQSNGSQIKFEDIN
nr:hypothetical protein [Tanacetum cinerariifolium]